MLLLDSVDPSEGTVVSLRVQSVPGKPSDALGKAATKGEKRHVKAGVCDPAEWRRLAAEETEAGAMEHLWGLAHQWVQDHCHQGQLYVPQLLRTANKRIHRDCMERLGRDTAADERPASLSPRELVDAHPDAFTAGEHRCSHRKLSVEAWKVGHLAHCVPCQTAGRVHESCYMTTLLATIERGWAPRPLYEEYRRLNWRSFPDTTTI